LARIAPCRIRSGPHIAKRYERERNRGQKENAMEVGIILIATNALMAAFIYFVINLIWKQ
jgi:hypothetical protein